MKTIRSFLAVNLDVKAAREVSTEQRKLRALLDDKDHSIKWVPPQNMHVTIRFLGNITEPMVTAIKDNLSPVTRNTAAFGIASRGWGAFPSVEAPEVLWAGIEDETGQLGALYGRVCQILENTGFKSDDRPFKSHVTVARLNGAPPPNLAETLAAGAGIYFGDSRIRNLVCYRSDLTGNGEDYQVLWSLPMLGKDRPEHKPRNMNNGSHGDLQEQNTDENE